MTTQPFPHQAVAATGTGGGVCSCGICLYLRPRNGEQSLAEHIAEANQERELSFAANQRKEGL